MAIQMNGTAVSSTGRDTFKAIEVETFENPFSSNDGLIGITPEFASNVTTKIDDLKTNIDNKLKEISDTQDNAAIKGEQVTAAIGNFIDAIVKVATSFNDCLSDAESSLIKAVEAAYKKQDEDLSGNLATDSATVLGQAVSSGSC